MTARFISQGPYPLRHRQVAQDNRGADLRCSPPSDVIALSLRRWSCSGCSRPGWLDSFMRWTVRGIAPERHHAVPSAHLTGGDRPAEVEGGNSEQFSSESPEGVLLGQDDPGMPKTGPITVGWREVERRAADWRMRPPSDDGRDNITRLERGPQGSGGASGSAPPGH